MRLILVAASALLTLLTGASMAAGQDRSPFGLGVAFVSDGPYSIWRAEVSYRLSRQVSIRGTGSSLRGEPVCLSILGGNLNPCHPLGFGWAGGLEWRPLVSGNVSAFVNGALGRHHYDVGDGELLVEGSAGLSFRVTEALSANVGVSLSRMSATRTVIIRDDPTGLELGADASSYRITGVMLGLRIGSR